MIPLDEAETLPPTCSRAGCREAAVWRLNWRNPRIHSRDRVKIWLACESHLGFLQDYLTNRAFPLVVTALSEPVRVVPDREAP